MIAVRKSSVTDYMELRSDAEKPLQKLLNYCQQLGLVPVIVVAVTETYVLVKARGS